MFHADFPLMTGCLTSYELPTIQLVVVLHILVSVTDIRILTRRPRVEGKGATSVTSGQLRPKSSCLHEGVQEL